MESTDEQKDIFEQFRLHKLKEDGLLYNFASIWWWPMSLLFQRHVARKKQAWLADALIG